MLEEFPELLRVQHKGLEVELRLVDAAKLRLHEEVFAEELLDVVDSLLATRVMRHPIVVDRNSAVVLDGTHRVEAARRLGLRWIPACLVDYASPAIRVDRWYKVITPPPMREVLELEFRRKDLKFESIVPEDALQKVEKGEIACAVVASTWSLGFQLAAGIWENYECVRQVEKSLASLGARLADADPASATEQLSEGRIDLVLATPPVDKRAIVDGALSGKLFPPRSTRHVVPGRLLKLEAPIEILAEQDLQKATEQLGSLIRDRKLKILPPNSKVNDRIYEEEVYIFEQV